MESGSDRIQFMDSIKNYYINYIEPLLDGMSNGEATVFGILLTTFIAFLIWLGKRIFTKKSKIITDKNDAERGEQTTATVNNQLPNRTTRSPCEACETRGTNHQTKTLHAR